MLKVVIVEDEVKICRMLTSFIDWGNLGFEIIGVANDGVSGFNMILEKKPDVVLTDIRMPGYDGIELIKKVKEQNEDTMFIIISGIKHFEHAHAAINLGAKHYLLKPIEENELISILQQIKSNYESNKSLLSEHAQAIQEVRIHRESLRNSLITTLLQMGNPFEGNLCDINQQYCTKFQPALFMAIILRCDRIFFSETSDHEHIHSALTELFSNIYTNYVYDIVVGSSANYILGIVNYNQENADNILRCHNRLLEQAHIKAETFGTYAITIGLGTLENDHTKALHSYHIALKSVINRMIFGTNKILSYESSSNHITYDYQIFFNSEIKHKFLSAVYQDKEKDIRELINKVFANVQQSKHIDAVTLYELCNDIFNDTADYLKQLSDMTFDREEEFRDRLNYELITAHTVDRLISILVKNIIELSHVFSKFKNRNSRVIINAKEFINSNFHKQIRLEDVAHKVNLNPTYFSGIFKKEIGLTYSEYLTNLRIEAAKKLLRTTSLNIISIAMECGYSDTKYFSKLFKKNVSIRPSEYRKLYSKTIGKEHFPRL